MALLFIDQVPTFLINLDRSPDRLAAMSSRAAEIGLAFERIAGVDGVLVPTHLHSKFFSNGVATCLSPGEIGCYASHLVTYAAIIDRSLPFAMILEDDGLLDASLGSIAAQAVAAAPVGWDIIKLCNRSSRVAARIKRIGDRHLVRFVRQPVLTTGYLISAAGASKMLAPGLRTQPIDMDMRSPWLFDLEVYGVLPEPVVVPRGGDSIIATMGGRAAAYRAKQRKRDFAYAAARIGATKAAACIALSLPVRMLPRRIRPRWVAI